MAASHRFMALAIVVLLGCVSFDFISLAEDSALIEAAIESDLDPEVLAVATALRSRHTGLKPEKIEPVAQAIVAESRRVGFQPGFVLAVIHVESSGYNYAMSSVGAMGLMQLLPTTAESIAPRLGVDWKGPGTLFDPVSNVRLGVSYLRQLVDRFDDVDTALAAYNWGPTAIATRLRRGEKLPQEYIRRVQSAYRRPPRGWALNI